MRAVDHIRCPVCGRPVRTDGKTLYCVGGEKSHSFDFASSGYVNLLSPGRGKNSHTGDDKAMISARTRFLDKGYYGRISERIGELISSFAEKDGRSEIFFADCACGEGYHTCNIIKTVAESGIVPHAAAFDASKYGADRGAKRASRLECGDAFFAAANIFSLPLADGSFDFALSIFAPIAWDETARILKDDGRLIVASSGERHLYELRQALYDEPREASGVVKMPGGYLLEGEETVSYTVTVEGNGAVADLFYMTPFCYKTSKSDSEKLSRIDRLEVTVEVKLSVFSKRN